MNVTITSLQIWSDNAQAVVTWTVTFTQETDDGGNIHQVVKATYNDEVLRFSPNITDAELQKMANQINTEAQGRQGGSN